MAVSIYKEISRRFGVESQQHNFVNSFNNQGMILIPDQPVQIWAPRKIFEALRLLGITMHSWKFKDTDGYIVSGTSDDIQSLQMLVKGFSLKLTHVTWYN